jgi:hypothetical protein
MTADSVLLVPLCVFGTEKPRAQKAELNWQIRGIELAVRYTSVYRLPHDIRNRYVKPCPASARTGTMNPLDGVGR